MTAIETDPYITNKRDARILTQSSTMGQKRTSYKRRIGAKDRIKREALRILPTLCPTEHLQALAELDQAIKNGQAKWAQDADTDDTPHLGGNGAENDFKSPHTAS